MPNKKAASSTIFSYQRGAVLCVKHCCVNQLQIIFISIVAQKAYYDEAEQHFMH